MFYKRRNFFDADCKHCGLAERLHETNSNGQAAKQAAVPDVAQTRRGTVAKKGGSTKSRHLRSVAFKFAFHFAWHRARARVLTGTVATTSHVALLRYHDIVAHRGPRVPLSMPRHAACTHEHSQGNAGPCGKRLPRQPGSASEEIPLPTFFVADGASRAPQPAFVSFTSSRSAV
jgi:hypothetical protein